MRAVAVSVEAGRAVGYLRVSTSDQADRGFGLDVQREHVERFCRSERHALGEVFSDPGVSGTVPLDERRGLSAAVEEIRAGRAACLVVARFDRLARDTLIALSIEQAVEIAGGRVLYAEGLNGRTDELEFMRTIMHAGADLERKRLVARLRAARAAKAAVGGYAGGRPPFGFEAVRGELVVRADEAEVVRWVFGQVARGRSVRSVARSLDEHGTLGRGWHPTQVQRIVRRREYKLGRPGERVVDPKVWNRANAHTTERSAA